VVITRSSRTQPLVVSKPVRLTVSIHRLLGGKPTREVGGGLQPGLRGGGTRSSCVYGSVRSSTLWCADARFRTWVGSTPSSCWSR
jgi:hypothetical protein